MGPLNPAEIALLKSTLDHLVGARLQKVVTSTEDVILEFWLRGQTYYLWFHDSALRPYLTFWPEELPFQIKKKVLPIQLFINAHLVNRILNQVIYDPAQGRVLVLIFGEGFHIEFRIFPHGQNVLAQAPVDGKSKGLSLHRAVELTALNQVPSAHQSARSVHDFSQAWKQFRNPLQKLKKQDNRQDKDQKPKVGLDEKIKIAIQKVEDELKRKSESPWRQIGEQLKKNQNFDFLPDEFAPFVDRRKSLAWNVTHCFEQAKENERKIKGTEKRLAELRQRLGKGESPKDAPAPQLKEKVENLRSFRVSSDVRALCGKSAKENLSLLRQAKAWDLWLHLKDVPSSHAIIFRPKGRAVSESELMSVIQWFFKQTLGKKWNERQGERFDVVVTECRFVKAIKGDRIGRVHYQNEKVLRVTVKA